MGDGTSGSADHIEIERKYDTAPDFILPGLAGLPRVTRSVDLPALRLAAIYFDTAGLHLAAAKITLRRRTGGPDAGWHLKLPGSADTRREVHAPLGPGTEPVPARLAALVAGQAGDQPLRPIARLETTRRLRRLTGPGGEVLAEIADDLVTGSVPAPGSGPAGLPLAPGTPGTPGAGAQSTGAQWRHVTRWREVEVELGTGPRDLLDAVGDLLLDAGARPSASGSKLSRLLAAAGATPARAGGQAGPEPGRPVASEEPGDAPRSG